MIFFLKNDFLKTITMTTTMTTTTVKLGILQFKHQISKLVDNDISYVTVCNVLNRCDVNNLESLDTYLQKQCELNNIIEIENVLSTNLVMVDDLVKIALKNNSLSLLKILLKYFDNYKMESRYSEDIDTFRDNMKAFIFSNISVSTSQEVCNFVSEYVGKNVTTKRFRISDIKFIPHTEVDITKSEIKFSLNEITGLLNTYIYYLVGCNSINKCKEHIELYNKFNTPSHHVVSNLLVKTISYNQNDTKRDLIIGLLNLGADPLYYYDGKNTLLLLLNYRNVINIVELIPFTDDIKRVYEAIEDFYDNTGVDYQKLCSKFSEIDINICDVNGDTFLNSLVIKNNEDAIVIFLGHGADPLILNKNKKNALDFAIETNNLQIILLILTHIRNNHRYATANKIKALLTIDMPDIVQKRFLDIEKLL